MNNIKKIKVLSLFDGISCARVALERAGVLVDMYYACEIDKYATQISQKNYPDIFRVPYGSGDVTKLKFKDSFPYTDIDLLIGGSPCQDLSIAKKNRKGLDGERSGLFYEYVRILNEVKPKYFILENVNSMPKEAKETITKELFGIEPIMINASLVSAQNRKRLFWVGKLDEFGTYKQVDVILPEDKGIVLKDILENGDTDRLKSYCIDANYWKGTNLEQYLKKARRQIVMLTETRTEEAKALRRESMKNGKDFSPRRMKELVPRNDEKSNTITTGQTKESLVAILQTPRGNNKGGLRALDGKTPTISSSSWENNNHLLRDTQIRKLTPIECERLQGLPDNYTDGVSNSQRYKALGNAFNVDVIAHILFSIYEEK